LHLTLTNASVGALADEPDAWPQPANLQLDGFVYKRFSGAAPRDAGSRLDWLARQPSFLPQPYRQVAKVLREEGEEAGAVKVCYEMERGVRARETGWWRVWVKNPALRSTIGYGYYPARAFWWLAGLVVSGVFLYATGYRAGAMTPTEPNAYAMFKKVGQLPSQYGKFNALVYSAESSLPVVRFGQIDSWQPDPSPNRSESEVQTFFGHVAFRISSARVLRTYQRIQVLFGWILGTLFVAGVTGFVRRN
jgi:hypothetical protein